MDAGSNALADSRPREGKGENQTGVAKRRRRWRAPVCRKHRETSKRHRQSRTRVDGPRNVVTLMQPDNKIPPAADRSLSLGDDMAIPKRSGRANSERVLKGRHPFPRVFMYRVSPKSRYRETKISYHIWLEFEFEIV